MNTSTAEDVLRAHAQASVALDLRTVILTTTPDGWAKATLLGNSSWTLTSYDITAQTRDGDDHVFDVRYATDGDPMTLRYRVREIDGAWKIDDVEHA